MGMPWRPDDEFLNAVGAPRIKDRQANELIGLARGLAADGKLNQSEVEYLQTWLAANVAISGMPVISMLYRRVASILKDGVASEDECHDLLNDLKSFSGADSQVGEPLRATTLPLDRPQPDLVFQDRRFCFTGTFDFGCRSDCEQAVKDRGGEAANLTMKVNYLVIGNLATESWKHSSYGNKIIKACEWRDSGRPIALVSESHWIKFLAEGPGGN
jgi:NAD-dependent DNA ligase